MLTNIFSPLQKLKHPSREQILVKRDDLIDPFISGNKWRKLKYILQHAQDTHKNHLVTFGGAYSNHLVATAAASARSGLKSTAFVRGEEVTNEMLVLCKLFGMQLIFVSREAYREKELLFDKYFSHNDNAYFIHEGGASQEGVRGCAEIVSELPKDTDHLFCAAGTGTTAAGLLKGIHENGLKTILHVIPVLKGGDFIAEDIMKHTDTLSQCELHTEYHFGGYAKTTPTLIEYIKKFTSEEGILIDPVYTAKMFYTIDDLISNGTFKAEEKIVALHTGGLLGIMGMTDKLYK
ncbi:MAG: pyridoxal-phosphate dependent enzyme [Bacteroidota bacterium]